MQGCRPDGISPRIRKSCANQHAGILQNIFNLSLLQGKIPMLWKKIFYGTGIEKSHPILSFLISWGSSDPLKYAVRWWRSSTSLWWWVPSTLLWSAEEAASLLLFGRTDLPLVKTWSHLSLWRAGGHRTNCCLWWTICPTLYDLTQRQRS